MSPVPDLFINQVQDQYSRENFRKLKSYLTDTSLWQTFKLFEVQFDRAESGVKFIHNLGFLPKDIILCSKTNGVTVTFNQDLTTSDSIDITVSGQCTVRFLAGTF